MEAIWHALWQRNNCQRLLTHGGGIPHHQAAAAAAAAVSDVTNGFVMNVGDEVTVIFTSALGGIFVPAAAAAAAAAPVRHSSMCMIAFAQPWREHCCLASQQHSA
jgi:hypothetical protein